MAKIVQMMLDRDGDMVLLDDEGRIWCEDVDSDGNFTWREVPLYPPRCNPASYRGTRKDSPDWLMS